MTAPLSRALAAELGKIRTLPTALLTMVGTVAAGAALGAALAASAADGGRPADAVEVTLATVPFVQPGLVLLGLLPVAHEYAGSQIRTSLAAVPDRAALIVGKTVATLLVTAGTAVATMLAVLLAAAATLDRLGAAAPDDPAGLGRVVAAAGCLVAIGLLAHGVALLLRHLVPTLVTTLALLLIVSPLAAARTEHARWLPDRAARQLYEASDTLLTPATGALVALAWMAVIGGIAAVRFARRDA